MTEYLFGYGDQKLLFESPVGLVDLAKGMLGKSRFAPLIDPPLDQYIRNEASLLTTPPPQTDREIMKYYLSMRFGSFGNVASLLTKIMAGDTVARSVVEQACDKAANFAVLGGILDDFCDRKKDGKFSPAGVGSIDKEMVMATIKSLFEKSFLPK